MSLTSVFKAPENSVTVGLAEAAAVYAIYSAALPNHADIRSADPHNTDIEAVRKRAAWKAASVLGLVFLITQDLNSFLIGGMALGGIDLMVKHSNAVHPGTGTMVPAGVPAAGDNVSAFPLPDYGSDEAVGY